jgi:hypothetical protein
MRPLTGSPSLLEQFLNEDCGDARVRADLLAALAPPDDLCAPADLIFNRFEITLDRRAGTALLIDVLQPPGVGCMTIDLEELRQAILTLPG